MNLSERILKKAKVKGYRVFSCYDFLDLANYKALSKALERLVNEGRCVRLSLGLFGLVVINRKLHVPQTLSSQDILWALTRKYGWKVVPYGGMAANELGLSQQVPAKIVLASTGPYKKCAINGYQFVFKHSFKKEISSLSPISNLVFQAFSYLGKDNLRQEDILKMLQNIGTDNQKKLMAESSYLPVWMSSALQKAQGQVCDHQ
jgi:hypothetical protein